MKLLLLADHQSVHTSRWALALAHRKIEILIFSLSPGVNHDYHTVENIKVFSTNEKIENIRRGNNWQKIRYITHLQTLKGVIRKFQPDILHAHYASSYGLLGALVGFHPYIISVWGSDVYDFPKGLITKAILRYNLRKADRILSTSEVMARESSKYTKKKIVVTHFGIDTNQFFKKRVSRKGISDSSMVIGTIKTLEPKYGIEYLIRAFKLLRDDLIDVDIKLLIVGGGSQEIELKRLCEELGITSETIFTGRVEHHLVPEYLNMLDVYVALSTLDSESFGVAILEASACEIPVVVSDVGGLPEVVVNGETGFVVPKKDFNTAYNSLKKILTNENLRIEMGKKGRKRVLMNYEWTMCVDKMMEVYRKIRD